MTRGDVDLPRSWTRATLSEIAEVRLGRQRSPARATGEFMRPYMRAANVTWSGIDTNDVKQMDFTPPEFEIYRLVDGDILLAEASGSAHEVGKPAIWRDQIPGACFQNTLIRVRADSELVRFLHLHFCKDAATGAFARASRGVGIHHLGSDAMKRWSVVLAPVPEQRRIVAAIDSYFSRLDDAVATLERVQRNLERYRASVLKAAVEGRLVPTEAEMARKEGRSYEPASELLQRILAERRRRWEEAELAKLKAKGQLPKDDRWKAKYPEPAASDANDFANLPEGWTWPTVDAVGDVLLGRQRAPQYLTGKYTKKYLRVANVKDDSIDYSDVEEMDFDPAHFEKYCLKPGDILISEGQSPELLGQSAIYRGEVKPLCFQKTLHRFRAVPSGPTPEFAQIVFRSHVRAGVFRSLGSITTNIAHLTLEKFRASPFPLPPAAEARRVEAEARRILSLADRAIEVADQCRRRVAVVKQAVLAWAFSGRLVDQDPTDEPASVLLDRIRAERISAKPATATRTRRRKEPVR